MAVGLRRATAALSIATIHCRSSAFQSLSLTTRALRCPSTSRTHKQEKDFQRFTMSTSASSVADFEKEKLLVASNIESVRQRVHDAIIANNRPDGSVRLVAVSKTKPLELLLAAYEVRCQFHQFLVILLFRRWSQVALIIFWFICLDWTASLWRELCTGTDDKIF